MIAELLDRLPPYILPVVSLAGSALVGFLFAIVLARVLSGIASRIDAIPNDQTRGLLRGPLSLVIPTLLLIAGIRLSGLPESVQTVLIQLDKVLVIIAVAWLIIRVILVAEASVLRRFDVGRSDNLRARKVHTQIRSLRRVATFLTIFLALGLVLLSFDGIREIGTTLLTTAGVAGIIVGFAAQKTLAMVIAGVQIAFTQPIRLGDAVVVEEEWGWIEEITLTYVVVKIWDWRRLVLPVTYFLEHPFQNWTKNSSRLIGSIYLYLDYQVPVGALREALDRALEGETRWDGEVKVVQVTDTTEHTMAVRVLLSAGDSPTLWDLRCHVRETLVTFVAENYPHALPTMRALLRNEHAPHETLDSGSRRHQTPPERYSPP